MKKSHILPLLLAGFSLATLNADVPKGLVSTRFSGNEITPCPACLCALPTGEVFVGVDLNGSLGKGANKGRIVRLIDQDHDGQADAHTVFANIDNPRGLFAVDTRLFVLHTVFDQASNKLTGMHLSLLVDANQDGVADGPPKILIRDISVAKHNQDRGADHTTNGIRMGIDGWIYVAVGDFGMVNATGADGRGLTMLGGGVLRVRPDGTEMEVYTHGLRNIYDIAIDPFMNIYTRGNTNDGGGWNVRFIHHIQSAEYGYPVLFKHFTNEILPALQDLGGGSGTGSMFFDEPGWPEAYTKVPLMCDWGRSHLYIHRLEPDGATFTQKPEDYIKVQQITDVDVDGSGRMYLGAWEGAGYSGNPKKGYVERVVPENWQYRPFPTLPQLTPTQLIQALKSPSATARLHGQHEILRRGAAQMGRAVLDVCADSSLSLESRVAAIFTLKQLAGSKANPMLKELCKDPTIREFAIRAMTDRISELEGVPFDLLIQALEDTNPRVQVAAAVALGRLGNPDAAPALLKIANPPTSAPDSPGGVLLHTGAEGPHAKPNSAMVLPHVAVQALRALRPIPTLVQALDTPHRTGALWAMLTLHDTALVDALISRLEKETEPAQRRELLGVLARLQMKEKEYDGSWWWKTRPDTHGPYYVLADWEQTAKITEVFESELEGADEDYRAFLVALVEKNKMKVAGVEIAKVDPKKNKKPKTPAIDLSKVAAGEGEVGKAAIEDVMVALKNVKGNPARGRELFTQQGCVTCHTIDKSEPPKGPYMGHVGSILSVEQIAESILKPNASISQGFASVIVTLKDGGAVNGFVTRESADEVELRDITGKVHVVAVKDIASRTELEASMMPPGLANALSMKDFVSLVTFLSQQKE